MVRGLGEHDRTKCSWRQKDDLPVGQVRCQGLCDVGLRRGRSGTQNERGTKHGLGNVGRDKRQARLMTAAKIFKNDNSAGDSMRLDRRAIASP